MGAIDGVSAGDPVAAVAGARVLSSASSSPKQAASSAAAEKAKSTANSQRVVHAQLPEGLSLPELHLSPLDGAGERHRSFI